MTSTFNEGEYFVGFVSNTGNESEICSVSAYKTDPFILKGGETSGFVCWAKGKNVDGTAKNLIRTSGNCKAYVSKSATEPNQYYTCTPPEPGKAHPAPTIGSLNAPVEDFNYTSCRENISFAPDQEHHYVKENSTTLETALYTATPGVNTQNCKYINYSKKTAEGKKLAGIIGVVDQNPDRKHSVNITPNKDTKLATGPIPYIKVTNLTQQDLNVRMCAENGFTCDDKTIKKGNTKFYNTETNVSSDSENIITGVVLGTAAIAFGGAVAAEALGIVDLGIAGAAGAAATAAGSAVGAIGASVEAVLGIAAEAAASEELESLIELLPLSN